MNKKFKLKVKKLNKEAKINAPFKEGDAGYDVFAMENIILPAQNRYAMPLGIALEFPPGFVCIVNQKSGIAKEFGIDTIGNVIDAGYRGEIHAQIVNTSKTYIDIKKGQKIAQLLFHEVITPEIEYCTELSESLRGDRKFGGKE